MRSLLLPLAGLLALEAGVKAQGLCFGPDLLTGPCCTNTPLNLPPLGPISMQAQSVQWNSCVLAGQDCIQVSTSAPLPSPVCGQWTVSIKVGDCAGNTQLFGNGVLDYARTWREQGNTVDPSGTISGTTFQVWRFLAKFDLSQVVGSPPPPPTLIPGDLAVNPAVFYYGYVDYVLDCTFGSFKNVVVLYHASDWLINFPGISGNLGGANPIGSHALVGPDNPINPFLPVDFLIPPGALPFDSLRAVGDINLPGTPAACNAEQSTTQGTYVPLAFGCLNPPSLGPIQSAAVQINGASSCGSSYLSVNLFGTVPWLDMITSSIGAWTTNNEYPGPERVRANEGLFVYRDSCQLGTPGFQAFEIFYGAETRGGFTATIQSGTTPPVSVANFLDLVSNWRRPAGTPLMLPAIGRVMNSYHVISLNPL